MNRLPGRHVLAPDTRHLQQMGEMLQRLADALLSGIVQYFARNPPLARARAT